MKKRITKLMLCCAFAWGMLTPAMAQLQSKIGFTLEERVQLKALTQQYVKQGLSFEQARMKAEKEIAAGGVKLRVGDDGYAPVFGNYTTVRTDLLLWPVDHAAWVATATYQGSIEVDRDTFIHKYKPSELVKKVLLKAYTPEDEARIQNVTFLGFNGPAATAADRDTWFDNPIWVDYGLGNRGLAYFTKGTSNFDIEKGLLLSTGQTWGHEGPNESTYAISDGVVEDGVSDANVAMTTTFDPDLAHIAQQGVSLGGILEFDFCPAIDKASFDYVFGSEEYPEYVHSAYNDVFGFFVSGPYESPGGSPTVTLPGTTWEKGRAIYNGEPVNTYNRFNIAQLPNGMPVGVDWTNWGYRWDNTDLEWDTPFLTNITAPWDTIGVAAVLIDSGVPNLHGSLYWTPPADEFAYKAFNPQYHRINKTGTAMMELDGITVKLTALMDSLVPGKWYHLKIGIAQVDWMHGDGVFIGNLDLGQATSGIGNNNSWPGWPAANDSLGLTHFYAGCSDTLIIDFDPQGFTQYVELVPKGALVGNIVDMEGNPVQLKDSLRSGQSRIVRIFKVDEDANVESGATGWFETYAYDPTTYLGTHNPSQAIAGDTSVMFSVYKRFTANPVFKRPTVGFPGSLNLNVQNGSPHLFRSLDRGLTWENAYLPFSQYQIANLAEDEGGYIILKEPNSCWNATISVSEDDLPPVLERPIWIPEISNAIISGDAKEGLNYVFSRNNFVFTITPTGASAGMVPVITTNRTSIPDSEGVKVEPNGDGSYTVTIYRIQEEIRITVDFSTSNESIEDLNKVWSANGQVYVTSGESGYVRFFNAAGKLLKTLKVTEGESMQTAVPLGFYIVTLNDKVYKVTVK